MVEIRQEEGKKGQGTLFVGDREMGWIFPEDSDDPKKPLWGATVEASNGGSWGLGKFRTKAHAVSAAKRAIQKNWSYEQWEKDDYKWILSLKGRVRK